jgi:hypothetical protein
MDITYTPLPDKTIQVKVEGKATGKIKPVDGGFAYFPKASKLQGATFSTVREVRDSLEEE